MFDWLLSYFEFLKNFFIFWWNLTTNISHWWEIPLILFAFLYSTLVVLCLTFFVLLMFCGLTAFLLSIFQRTFKFKFPIIGDYLQRFHQETPEERIKRDEEMVEKVSTLATLEVMVRKRG